MKKTALLVIALLLLSAPAFAQMQMPPEVYATLKAVVAKYPHTGDDDQRKLAMRKVVETIRARHGLRWVWKTEHQSMVAPPEALQVAGSKDGLGYVAEEPVVHGQAAVMFIFDTISGGTRQPYGAPLVSEPARQSIVLAVPPKDWLADTTTEPPPSQPPSPTPPAVDLGPLLARLAALEGQVSTLRQALAEVPRIDEDRVKVLAQEWFDSQMFLVRGATGRTSGALLYPHAHPLELKVERAK